MQGHENLVVLLHSKIILFEVEHEPKKTVSTNTKLDIAAEILKRKF